MRGRWRAAAAASAKPDTTPMGMELTFAVQQAETHAQLPRQRTCHAVTLLAKNAWGPGLLDGRPAVWTMAAAGIRAVSYASASRNPETVRVAHNVPAAGSRRVASAA